MKSLYEIYCVYIQMLLEDYPYIVYIIQWMNLYFLNKLYLLNKWIKYIN